MLHLSDYTLRSGATGKSAYDVAVANGFVGTVTQWIASLQGIQGKPGAGTAVKGTVANYGALPTTGLTLYDLYLMQAGGTDPQGQAYAAGDGYVYTGGSPAWLYVGPIRGPVGPAQTDASALSTGTLAAARLPALIGDVTATAGTGALAITAGAVKATHIDPSVAPTWTAQHNFTSSQINTDYKPLVLRTKPAASGKSSTSIVLDAADGGRYGVQLTGSLTQNVGSSFALSILNGSSAPTDVLTSDGTGYATFPSGQVNIKGSYPSLQFLWPTNPTGLRGAHFVFDTTGTLQYQILNDDGSIYGVPFNINRNASTFNVPVGFSFRPSFSGATPWDSANLHPSLLPFATPEMFGPAGSGDDTAIVQAALDTGKPVLLGQKQYAIKRALLVKTPGQSVRGVGRGLTILATDLSFDANAAGVLVLPKGQADSCVVSDLTISANLGSIPSNTLPSAVKNYPPAVYARGCTRWTLERVGLLNHFTCIDMRGNAGGAYLKDVWLSAYGFGVRIDGALDTVRAENVHGYVFNITNTAAQNANVVWWDIGRVDDLKISNSLSIFGTHFNFYLSAPAAINENNGGAATGCLVGYDFDVGNLGINFSGGNMTATACYFACTAMINQTGGSLSVTDFTTSSTVNSCVALNSFSGGKLILGDCRTWFLGHNDITAIYNAHGTMILHDIFFVYDSNAGANRTNPVIMTEGNGARLIAHDNYIDDRGTGTGTDFIKVVADNFHRIHHNCAPGWTYNLPASQSSGVYGPN